jgi:hypothetical protein
MKGVNIMKKTYETPTLDLIVLKANDFLSTSGDATENDGFDGGYGETFA